MLYVAEYASPVGTLYLGLTDSAVKQIRFTSISEGVSLPSKGGARALAERLYGQLNAYFSGKRVLFDVPLELDGTEYRKRVWKALLDIPFGQTISYKELARRVGSGARAVGQANHHNPVNIIVPCHRVVGLDGSLTGYGGGVDRKQWLLDHEKASIGIIGKSMM
jgi:methylated-DNA-[protein]-cysteine S-methyltransferase